MKKNATPKTSSKSVRFVSMQLHDYGLFRGSHEFKFSRHRTVIVGEGKTTAAQALVQMGAIKGVLPNCSAQCPDMFVEVETEGNRQLIQKYRAIIDLSYKSADALTLGRASTITRQLSLRQRTKLTDEINSILEELLPRKFDKMPIDACSSIAQGERICRGYAFAFALRRVLGLNLPVVFDSPYAMLSELLRHNVSTFLCSEPTQQICFTSAQELTAEEKPNYCIGKEA